MEKNLDGREQNLRQLFFQSLDRDHLHMDLIFSFPHPH